MSEITSTESGRREGTSPSTLEEPFEVISNLLEGEEGLKSRTRKVLGESLKRNIEDKEVLLELESFRDQLEKLFEAIEEQREEEKERMDVSMRRFQPELDNAQRKRKKEENITMLKKQKIRRSTRLQARDSSDGASFNRQDSSETDTASTEDESLNEIGPMSREPPASPTLEEREAAESLSSIDAARNALHQKRHKRHSRYPKDVTQRFKRWMVDNLEHPYPSEEQKLRWVEQTGLSLAQINNFFTNARRRFLKRYREQLTISSPTAALSLSRLASTPTNNSPSGLTIRIPAGIMQGSGNGRAQNNL